MNFRKPFDSGKASQFFNKAGKTGRFLVPIIVVIIALLIMGANAIYTVNNGEEAVITRFGKHVQTVTSPGLQLKIPFADRASIVNVEEVRRMEFGFRSNEFGSYSIVQEEALMLTGEESRVNGLVNADWVVAYRVSDSYNYLFKVQQPVETLRTVTQAAYRRIAAAYPLDAILTDRKEDIQRDIRIELQSICNLYEIGVFIIAVQLQEASPPEQVRDAFLDVTRALEDKIAKTNQAERYRNEQIPLAEGNAAASINVAEAYKSQRINEALGAVSRYRAIEEEYRNSPDIMRTRLYLEMIREVLPRVEEVYFLDQASGNLLELLHLGQ